MKPPPPLVLALRRSRLAAALIVASHAATAALLLALPLPAGLPWVGACAIAIGCARALARAAGRSAPVLLHLGLDRRIAVTTRDARTLCGDVLADSFVGRWLTTIVWRADGARRARTLMVMSDATAADDFRRLRVALRYGRAVESRSPTSGVDAT